MPVDSHFMFSVPLLKTKVTPWNEIKPLIVDIIGDTMFTDDRGLRTDFYNNSYNTELWEVLRPFVSEITEQCMGLPTPDQPPNMWSQKYSSGVEHSLHNHGNRGYSFILYIKYNPQVHRATKFISPFDSFFNGDMLCFEPQIEEGDLIAFPSVVKHSSQIQTSDEERQIVSFNLYEHGVETRQLDTSTQNC